jgi:selenoprotein W-related protein
MMPEQGWHNKYSSIMSSSQGPSSTKESIITIEYCPKCGWMLRAAYMAQELLTSFTGDIKGILLQPSETSGTYTISVNHKMIFDRKSTGRFPEIKELKQLVRDEVAPTKNLGHSDRK